MSPCNEIKLSDFSSDDMIFSHWFCRKMDIISRSLRGGGEKWSPKENIAHKLIDDELDRYRPLRNSNLPIFCYWIEETEKKEKMCQTVKAKVYPFNKNEPAI